MRQIARCETVNRQISPDLRQDVLCVEQVDGLDVAEDGGDHLLGEHVLGPVLAVHPEVEDLK